MMPDLSRRTFVKLASTGCGAVLVGFDPLARSWISAAQVTPPRWTSVPTLDGALVFDDSVRESMSVDAGGSIHRMPTAVLRPASVTDIVKMVRFANQHDLKIVARGQGHSQYGQTLVDAGIVIDSSTLNAVQIVDPAVVSAQAGASWNDVTTATLARNLTPPAMGNTMTLSVGGILSAGGVSNRSHLLGAVADTVIELDVVTGDGTLVTCSSQQNRELFEMVLGGMGQCALIAGTRIRLTAAPACVVRQDFFYDDGAIFLRDLTRLTLEGKLDHLAGYAPLPNTAGATRFRINAGKFCATPDTARVDLDVGDLRFQSQGAPVSTSYADYLQREAASNAAAAAARRMAPTRAAFITVFVPLEHAEDLIRSILASPIETAGLVRFAIQPLLARTFTRPLLKLPSADVIVSIWLFRNVPTSDAAAFANLTGRNHAILERVKSMGGKAYPPYAPYFTPAEWQDHYGSETWRRLTGAKHRFDPRGVLTPGPGVFRATQKT